MRSWRKASGAARVLLIVGAVLILGAALQYNDDFPLLWGAIYGLTGGLCVVSALGALPWLAPALWSVCLGGGAVWQHLREAQPCWENLGCLIGSDVPGLVVNGVAAAGAAVFLAWPRKQSATIEPAERS